MLCEVLVENLTEIETKLYVCREGYLCSSGAPYSYLYDSSGNQYVADVFALGGKEQS